MVAHEEQGRRVQASNFAWPFLRRLKQLLSACIIKGRRESRFSQKSCPTSFPEARPLYPTARTMFSLFKAQAPTFMWGSSLRCEAVCAMLRAYCSHEILTVIFQVYARQRAKHFFFVIWNRLPFLDAYTEHLNAKPHQSEGYICPLLFEQRYPYLVLE